MDLENQVVKILSEKTLIDAANLSPGQLLREVGIDSLGIVETIFALEEAFDISIPFSEGEAMSAGAKMETVADLVSVVQGLVAQKTL